MSIERIFQEERNRSCLSKRRWKSEAEGGFQAAAIARRSGREMDVYHCPWCKGWHLSTRKEEAKDV